MKAVDPAVRCQELHLPSSLQALNTLLVAGRGPPVAECGLDSTVLAEEAGAACGPSLTTVYDFWEAANHTFPGKPMSCGGGKA